MVRYVQQDLLDFGVGDLGGLPMSFLQPLEQPPAGQPAASAQDGEADSDEGGEDGQGDPQLESSMYMMNDSEPGPCSFACPSFTGVLASQLHAVPLVSTFFSQPC